jgi:hypothetical protein
VRPRADMRHETRLPTASTVKEGPRRPYNHSSFNAKSEGCKAERAERWLGHRKSLQKWRLGVCGATPPFSARTETTTPRDFNLSKSCNLTVLTLTGIQSSTGIGHNLQTSSAAFKAVHFHIIFHNRTSIHSCEVLFTKKKWETDRPR